MRANRGFTLIEIMVAAILIGVLSTIGVVSYTAGTRRSRDAKRTTDLEQIRAALELYRADIGYYPPAGSGSWTSASGLATYLVDTYISSVPSDPTTGQDYRFRAMNLQSGQYYGYCVSALLESGHPGADPCTPYSGHNYSAKNP